jgi:hypothetical protein
MLSSGPSSLLPPHSIFVVKTVPKLYLRKSWPAARCEPPAFRIDMTAVW